MMTRQQIETATLDQLNEELAAAGFPSNETNIAEARKAVLAVIHETQNDFSITWEFMGSATQEHFDVAQAVADAMESLSTPVVTSEVLNLACDSLGDDWDVPSVKAMIENCSFRNNEEAESA